MSVEEDMKSFFPQKFKEPMSALSSLTRLESQNDPNEKTSSKELKVGSVDIMQRDEDIEHVVGQLKGIMK